MRYAKVENSVIVRVYPYNPNWMNDDGTVVSDERYASEFGIYPLVEPKENNSGFLERDTSNWIYGDDNITVTYYSVIDVPPVVDSISQSVVRQDESNWVYDEIELTVTYTYDIMDRTDQEISEYVESMYVSGSEKDGYVIKPEKDWVLMDSGFGINKTYWEITPDPRREDFPEVLYNITQTDSSTWISDGDTIQEECVFEPKDVSDIKSPLKASITSYRYDIEVGGYLQNGVIVDTDRESQSKILSKYTYIKVNNVVDGEIGWKTQSGFTTLTILEFIDMAEGIENFIQTLYLVESNMYASMEVDMTFDEMKSLYESMGDLFYTDKSSYLLDI